MTLILGDNIFYGGDGFKRAFADFKAARRFLAIASTIPNVTAWWNLTTQGRAISIEEKPQGAAQQLRRAGTLYL